MASQNTRIVKLTDAQIVSAFVKVWKELDQPPDATWQLDIGERSPVRITGKMIEISDHPEVQRIQKLRATLLQRATLGLGNGYSISVIRKPDHCDLALNFPDKAPPKNAVPKLAVMQAPFQKFDAAGSLSAVLGPEIAQFYDKREEALLRLESLAEEVITRTEDYRSELDVKYSEREARLDAAFDEKEKELHEEVKRRHRELESRKEALDERVKALDDRSNTHARRKIREDLKKILEARNTSFQLTKETQQKRWPIHILFILLVLLLGAYATDLVSDQFLTDQLGDWPGLLRAALALGSVAVAIGFYIAWNDRWADRHAEEEFRLRQLELDVDRASWVVEMALEWKAERGADIPQNLIDSMTGGLFERSRSALPEQEKQDDLASALVRASSGLSLEIPGFGTIKLDRKGVDRFRKAMDEESG